MRVCIVKATNKLIEMQSSASEGTLLQNALNAGYTEADIEEKEVTDAEYQTILDAQPTPTQPPTNEDRLKALEDAMTSLMGL